MSKTKLTQQESEEWGRLLNERVRNLDQLRKDGATLTERIKAQDAITEARRKLGMKPSW